MHTLHTIRKYDFEYALFIFFLNKNNLYKITFIEMDNGRVGEIVFFINPLGV